jgi:hypothetical protein
MGETAAVVFSNKRCKGTKVLVTLLATIYEIEDICSTAIHISKKDLPVSGRSGPFLAIMRSMVIDGMINREITKFVNPLSGGRFAATRINEHTTMHRKTRPLTHPTFNTIDPASRAAILATITANLFAPASIAGRGNSTSRAVVGSDAFNGRNLRHLGETFHGCLMLLVFNRLLTMLG